MRLELPRLRGLHVFGLFIPKGLSTYLSYKDKGYARIPIVGLQQVAAKRPDRECITVVRGRDLIRFEPTSSLTAPCTSAPPQRSALSFDSAVSSLSPAAPSPRRCAPAARAGSSFGSWGTSRPRTASWRTVWRSGSTSAGSVNRSSMRSAMRAQATSTSSGCRRPEARRARRRAGRCGWSRGRCGRPPAGRAGPSAHRLWRRCGAARRGVEQISSCSPAVACSAYRIRGPRDQDCRSAVWKYRWYEQDGLVGVFTPSAPCDEREVYEIHGASDDRRIATHASTGLISCRSSFV